MSGDRLQPIISALDRLGCRPKRERDGVWRAHSPLREDRTPSLQITDTGDRILMHDFGGGQTREIVERLGLTMSDLYRTPAPRAVGVPTRRIAVYPYEDSYGELLAAKSRFEPKGFRWRHASDETRRRWREAPWLKRTRADIVTDIGKARPGAWMSGQGGTNVSIYRLPDLVDHRRVVVVNGEKAADRLWLLGIAATCGPSGEGQWSEAYTDAVWRSGAAEVVVLPDNDKPGREGSLRVARSCHRYRPASFMPISPAEPWASWPNAESDDPEVAPLRAKVLMLDGIPHRGDVVDWLGAGHEAGELLALMDAAPDLDAVEDAKRDRARAANRKRQQRYRDRHRATSQPRNAEYVQRGASA